MRIVIARTIANFSMDAYADGIINGLKQVRPSWDIVDMRPQPIDRDSASFWTRVQKAYERFWHFPNLVRKQQANVYHIIEAAEAHAVYKLKRKDKTVVVTCHDLINFHNQANLEGSVQLPFVSRNLWLYAIKGMEKADHVVAVSEATTKETAQILNINPSQISTIHNGVESLFQPLPKKTVAQLRQRWNLHQDTLCLLNVGSNHPRKNILNILRAIELLKNKAISVYFWKAGDDFTEEQKTFISDHHLSSCVSYIGKPDQTQLMQRYAAADVLVAPSLQEGFGFTLIEAMAMGTAVVTSNISAMPEVAGDAAALVDPTDVKAIAAAIQHLAEDETYRQMLIRKGLERSKQFTWKASAEKLAKVYELLVISCEKG